MNRRIFINHLSVPMVLGALNPLELLRLVDKGELFHLTIMHTNDVHSRIDPFPPDSGRNSGQGGVARRKVLIDQIRAEGQQCLLLDAGDIFQGTPYFNLYGGELEMKLMSALGYDAATIGNHDFDGGIDSLVTQMDHANFPFVISNYDVSDSQLNGYTDEVKIWDFGEIRVGMYALGIELEGLVPAALYQEVRYLDPITVALDYEHRLKKEHDCDYVICLSHLGYKYDGYLVSDIVIAERTSYTDLIIGGHTHTFMRAPHEMANALGRKVLINQVGFAGIYLGRIDLFFDKGSKGQARKAANIPV